LDLIRQAFDASNTVSSAICTYTGLTEIASDNGSLSFTTTHAWVAYKTGLSPRTVQDRTKDLVSIGLLKFSVPPGVKVPGRYELIFPADAQPLPDDKQSLPDDAQPLPNVRQRAKYSALPSLEENKELKNKRREEPSPSDDSQMTNSLPIELQPLPPRIKKAFAPPSIDQVKLHAAKIGLAEIEAQKFFNYYESNGWRVGRNPMKSWPASLAKWKDNVNSYATYQRINQRGPDRNAGTYNATNDHNALQSKVR